MRKVFILLLLALMVTLSSCSKKEQGNLVLVKGGTFLHTKSNYYGHNVKLANFYIGKYEVTQKEWTEIMGSNPSEFKGDNLPVEKVSWYDCIEYCNKRSKKEGLKPYYNIDKNNKDSSYKSENDNVKWTVTVNADANGYRLPLDPEWEYAAEGGQLSKNYKYSGSNHVKDVAWYWKNSGNKPLSGTWNWPSLQNNKSKTKSVGSKKANELGIYDMSGNVREWCWDWYEDENIPSGYYRICRGGGWMGDDVCCESTYRGKFEANGIGSDQGFRVCRSQ